MPNKDGTGPKGEGSKTGRQMGNCANKNLQGFNRDGGGNGNPQGCRSGRCKRMNN